MIEDESSLLSNISDNMQGVVGSFLPIGSLISDNTSKDMVEYLFSRRIKEQGDKKRYYWFPISFNNYNILLGRVTVICDEYIVGLVIYKLPQLEIYSQWRYTDNIELRNNNDDGLDYNIIEKLLVKKHDTLYSQLLDIFTYLYNLGYWTYGGFKNYEPRILDKYNDVFVIYYAVQQGIRIRMDINGNAKVIMGKLSEKQKQDLTKIGITIIV